MRESTTMTMSGDITVMMRDSVTMTIDEGILRVTITLVDVAMTMIIISGDTRMKESIVGDIVNILPDIIVDITTTLLNGESCDYHVIRQ